LVSAGAPQIIKLSADRTTINADNQDLSYVTVELLDRKGIRNITAENSLTFEISGPGTIIGVGNANPISLESYQRPQRKAWQGRALVIVKAGEKQGPITLTARAAGLPAATISLQAR
jgi:beta-galactosidase